MKKSQILIAVALLFTVSTFAQNVVYKVGGNLFASYTNTDFGYLAGGGISLTQRLEFKDSPFEVKNHISYEGLNNLELKYATHNIMKVGLMGEYNFLRFGHINRFGNDWTPYVGIGGNFVMYRSSNYAEKLEADNIEYVDGYTFGLRTSLGVKYKINKRFILSAETYLDWDYSDELDGWIKDSKENDNSFVFSLGLTYRI